MSEPVDWTAETRGRYSVKSFGVGKKSYGYGVRGVRNRKGRKGSSLSSVLPLRSKLEGPSERVDGVWWTLVGSSTGDKRCVWSSKKNINFSESDDMDAVMDCAIEMIEKNQSGETIVYAIKTTLNPFSVTGYGGGSSATMIDHKGGRILTFNAPKSTRVFAKRGPRRFGHSGDRALNAVGLRISHDYVVNEYGTIGWMRNDYRVEPLDLVDFLADVTKEGLVELKEYVVAHRGSTPKKPMKHKQQVFL